MARPVVAVVLAGGIGERMGLDLPKQLITIAGSTSLEHVVALFQNNPRVDQIVVMMEPRHLGDATALIDLSRYTKLIGIFPGGVTRNESSRLALEYIPDPDAKVIYHDAVRPLLAASITDATIDALDDADAVDVAIPSADTIIEVADHKIVSIPERSKLQRGQTPQGFRRSVIAEAYERAAKDPQFQATDDCGVVLKYLPDVPITVVAGDETNIKLTKPSDVHLADKLFQLRRDNDFGNQPVTGLRGKVVVILGGSEGIGHSMNDILVDQGAIPESLSRHLGGVDVRDRSSIRKALADIAARHGQIDHVVLTAGLLRRGPIEQMSDDDLRDSLDTNLTSAYLVAQESIGYLRASHGSLLLFTSSSATRGRPSYAVYSSTKAALVNLTQALADEWAPDHVRVNCISPSRTATPMRRGAFGAEPEGTLLSSDAVAWGSVRVLAGDQTGQIFDIRLPSTDPAPSLDTEPA